MKIKVPFYFALLLLTIFAFNVSGCSKLFGPSDEDVIKAVSESGVFKGGFGGLTLTAPIVILEKGGRNKDGSWPVKVKATFTHYINKTDISAPMDQTLIFNMQKAKDNADHTIWKATLTS